MAAPAIDLELVRRALRLPLPGVSGQLPMAPHPRTPGVLPPSQYLESGVVVLLYPHAGALWLVLTLRAENLAAHAGQISFPGGLREPEDASFAATALREMKEELGLDPATVELLGELSPLEIPVSGYRIHPWVAYAPLEPVFQPDPREVAALLTVPLAHLLDPANTGLETRILRGVEVTVPFYRVGAHQIWGATAMVLSEFLTLLRAAGRA